MGFLGKFFSKFSKNEFSPADERELEQVLLESDLGSDLTAQVLKAAQSVKSSADRSSTDNGLAALEAVRKTLRGFLLDMPRQLPSQVDRPTVILIVGVNGTGKTTSTAKLAYFLQHDGKKVLLAAADTFRAAAVEQISTWAERLEIPIVTGQAHSDPAAVAFEAASRAVNEKFDVLIIDTAGRLHTKSNLMDELAKIKRVVEKVTPIDEILFVLDGTTGQNGIIQAKVFAESVALTGLIVTKLDGSAKGGVALATEVALGVPIKFIGTGETERDFASFDPDSYIDSLTE